jgi:flagellar L-ring protein precursor FlgH
MNACIRRLVLPACAALLLAACGTTPSTITQGPSTARPVAPAVQTTSNGAIYQAAAYRPLFEDRRARQVGDILTIAINEKTQAGKQASSSGSKTGSADASISALLGLSATTLNRATVTASSDNQFEDESALNSSNSFSGDLTVTVVEVLANGNLVVAGEKQIGFDKGIEYVRLSGVVQPDTILAGNTVPSAKVADARIEYRTSAKLDTAEVMGWLARFFLSVAPL